jgi:hypothetical protein
MQHKLLQILTTAETYNQSKPEAANSVMVKMIMFIKQIYFGNSYHSQLQMNKLKIK